MFLSGGNAALLYAAKYNDVHKVVNIAGRFNLERGIEGRLGKDFLRRIKQDGFIDFKSKRGKLSCALILIFRKHQLFFFVWLCGNMSESISSSFFQRCVEF